MAHLIVQAIEERDRIFGAVLERIENTLSERTRFHMDNPTLLTRPKAEAEGAARTFRTDNGLVVIGELEGTSTRIRSRWIMLMDVVKRIVRTDLCDSVRNAPLEVHRTGTALNNGFSVKGEKELLLIERAQLHCRRI
jgi:hypothetical protein